MKAMIEPDEPKRGRWARVAWLGLYAVLSAVEFVVSALKDFVEERVKGEKKDDDDDDEGDK